MHPDDNADDDDDDHDDDHNDMMMMMRTAMIKREKKVLQYALRHQTMLQDNGPSVCLPWRSLFDALG